jgi:hypothetical protein
MAKKKTRSFREDALVTKVRRKVKSGSRKVVRFITGKS